MVGLLAHEVEHHIHGDPSDEFTLGVGDGRRHQVLILEQAGHTCPFRRRRNRTQRGVHDLHHLAPATERDDVGQRDAAEIAAVTVGHTDGIELVRQPALLGTVQGDVLLRHRQRDVGPHGDGIDIHQAASTVVRIFAHQIEARATLGVHAGQHRLDDAGGQLVVQVRKLVQIEALHRTGEFGGGARANQLRAHFAVKFDEDVALQVRPEFAPDAPALFRRQGLQQVRELRRPHRRQQGGDRFALVRRQR